jgi:hypothetical protein
MKEPGRLPRTCGLKKHVGWRSGFEFARQRGTSHRIYKYPGWVGLLNFQNVNGEAKDYQVKQLLEAVEELSLALDSDDLE